MRCLKRAKRKVRGKRKCLRRAGAKKSKSRKKHHKKRSWLARLFS